jgi:hypothetical protein
MPAWHYHGNRLIGKLHLLVETELMDFVVSPTEQDGVGRKSSSVGISRRHTSNQVLTGEEELLYITRKSHDDIT